MRIMLRRAAVAAVLVGAMVGGAAGIAAASPLDDASEMISEGIMPSDGEGRDTPGLDSESVDEVPVLVDLRESGREFTGPEGIPVVDPLLCDLTDDEFALLGYCPEDKVIEKKSEDGGEYLPEKDPSTYHDEKAQEHREDPVYHDKDDSRVVPVGGIETGGGGTAGGGSGHGPATLLAGTALAGLAGALGWRRRLGLTD